MRKIFTLSLLGLFGYSFSGFSQCSPTQPTAGDCNQIVEDFTTTNGGFTSATFTYSLPNGNFSRAAIGTNVMSTITSRTFTKIGEPNVILAGFDLGRQNSQITITSVLIEVLNSTNQVIASCTKSNPTIGTNCFGITDADIDNDASLQLRFTFVSTSTNSRTISFDNFRLVGANITLPVKFIGLEAKKTGNGTLITWNVADETDVDRYEIEKSSNSRNYNTIGFVKAAARSSYTFTDASVTPVSFYRIKSVDIDGRLGYSTFISFKNGKGVILLRAYPTPAKRDITVEHATTTNSARIYISSEDGRLVKSIIPASGTMKTVVNLFNLKAGLYLLRFADGNGKTETIKFLKN